MNAARLFRFFPPPLYLTMPHSGMSLSDDGVRTIGFVEKHGHTSVSHFSFDPLPAGVISSGTIEKPDELIAILKKIRARHGIEFVAGSIPDEKAYIFKVSIPRQEGINVSDIVAFKTQETVPISGPDAIFDFTITNQTPQVVDVAVRAVHQKVVAVYLNVFEAAGIHPLLFKIQSQAVADAVLGLHDDDPRIIVHMELEKTLCMIVHRRAVQFSTVTDVGTNSFISALEKSFSISSDEARLLIKGLGTIKKSHEDIFFSIGNIMSVIRDQIMKFKEYWHTKNEAGATISMLMISGMPASIDGLTHYFEEGTGLPTKAANVWENAFSLDHRVPPIPFSEALDYAPAIGLGLPKAIHL